MCPLVSNLSSDANDRMNIEPEKSDFDAAESNKNT